MRRFVVLSSIKRGVIDPPEQLYEFDEMKADQRMTADLEAEWGVERRRITSGYQLERDPEISFGEAVRLYGRRGNSLAARAVFQSYARRA